MTALFSYFLSFHSLYYQPLQLIVIVVLHMQMASVAVGSFGFGEEVVKRIAAYAARTQSKMEVCLSPVYPPSPNILSRHRRTSAYSPSPIRHTKPKPGVSRTDMIMMKCAGLSERIPRQSIPNTARNHHHRHRHRHSHHHRCLPIACSLTMNELNSSNSATIITGISRKGISNH